MTTQRSDSNVTEPDLDDSSRDTPDVTPELAEGDPRLGAWAQQCPEIPPDFTIPAGWKCDRTGIKKVVERRNGDAVDVRVTYGPILPVAVHIDPDHHQLVELVWYDGRRWINRLIPREVAKAGKKLVAAVGNLGLPATDGGGRDLESWLAAAEALNRKCIPEKKVGRWLGWQSDGTFIASVNGARIEPAFEEQGPALRAHHAKGTLEGWQAGVAVIERLPVAKMALYAGFAAPLLEALGVNSFTIDFSGRSTRGKTTAAKIGLSCFADPSQHGDGIANWQTTQFAIEKRLNLVRGLPVLLDETRLVSAPEVVDKTLYSVGMNHGRSRSGGYASSLPWSCVVITTGEQPAVSHTTHQGASARVISITQPPFGTGDAENGQAAMTVGREVDENYGHAGPVFVERLRALLAEPDGKEALTARHKQFTEMFRGSSDISGRRAPLVAVLAVAAEKCHQWGLVPGLTLPKPRVWQDLFTQDDATDNRPEQALDAVREWVAANGTAIWYPGSAHSGRPQPSGGWIGRISTVDEKCTVSLMPMRLKTALEKLGITLEAVLPAWRESGALVKSAQKDRPWDPKQRVAGPLVRLYTFSPEALGEYEPASDTGYSGHATYRD